MLTNIANAAHYITGVTVELHRDAARDGVRDAAVAAARTALTCDLKAPHTIDLDAGGDGSCSECGTPGVRDADPPRLHVSAMLVATSEDEARQDLEGALRRALADYLPHRPEHRDDPDPLPAA